MLKYFKTRLMHGVCLTVTTRARWSRAVIAVYPSANDARADIGPVNSYRPAFAALTSFRGPLLEACHDPYSEEAS